jgi:hypothetical protein
MSLHPAWVGRNPTIKGNQVSVTGRRVFTAAVCAVLVLFVSPASAQVSAAAKKYTTTADFNLGTAFNTDTSGDQIDLATVVTTFPLLWVANAGDDTVSKVDTTTGKETARYKTWFTGTGIYGAHLGNAYAGAAPSRTAVDTQGNVYVGNRHFDGRPPVLLKILSSGFIDRNGNGIDDTSKDTNNNGVIDPAELLPMVDSNNNAIIDPSEIQDEHIAWATRLPAGEANGWGRSVSIDTAGNVWFGVYNTQRYYKVRGTDGVILSGPHSTIGNTPYGSVIDSNGILWGASLTNNLLKLDTTDPDNAAKKQLFFLPASNYGIALGTPGGVQHIYMGSQGSGRYIDFNTATNTATLPACGTAVGSYGVATDGAGNIYMGFSSGIRKCSPAGAQIWTAGLQPGGQTGFSVAVDSDQNAWLLPSPGAGGAGPGKIAKYDGATGAALGVFNVGNSPYTYSDATGIGIFQAQRQGTWSVTQTSGLLSGAWRVAWNTEPQAAVPSGTTLTVEARTAATQAGLAAASFSPVSNGGAGCVTGLFIEVRATLTSNSGATPILSDAAINGKCDIDGNGVVNSSDIAAINAARNTASSGVCDMRDADGNGIINVNDARQCAVKCTLANCQ